VNVGIEITSWEVVVIHGLELLFDSGQFCGGLDESYERGSAEVDEAGVVPVGGGGRGRRDERSPPVRGFLESGAGERRVTRGGGDEPLDPGDTWHQRPG
jgi:hypothetical protein